MIPPDSFSEGRENRMRRFVPCVAALVVFIFSLGMMPGYAFLITTAPGTVFDTDTAAMDAALGITGFQIENFEDVNLVNGLSIEYTDPDAGPVTVLPNLYDPSARWQNNPWDGIYALANTPANQDWNDVGFNQLAKVTTFHINGGVAAFGVGLANFQSDRTTHTLFVNGIDFGIIDGLPDFDSGIHQRNMYVIINAGQGESILSVGFGNEAKGAYISWGRRGITHRIADSPMRASDEVEN